MTVARLRQVGAEGLSDAELLALLLGRGAGEPALVRATRLLEDHGGLHALAQRGIGTLAAEPGIGEATASRLLAAAELGRRLLARPLPVGGPIRRSQQVADALGPKMALLDHERVVALALDARGRLLTVLLLGQGGLVGCSVGTSDILRRLLLEGAHAAILVHNHPSGDPSPSPSDLDFTAHLAEALVQVGLELLDHVILARGGHFSFRDAGILLDQEGPQEPAQAAERGPFDSP